MMIDYKLDRFAHAEKGYNNTARQLRDTLGGKGKDIRDDRPPK